jgi:hypothetical protein
MQNTDTYFYSICFSFIRFLDDIVGIDALKIILVMSFSTDKFCQKLPWSLSLGERVVRGYAVKSNLLSLSFPLLK